MATGFPIRAVYSNPRPEHTPPRGQPLLWIITEQGPVAALDPMRPTPMQEWARAGAFGLLVFCAILGALFALAGCSPARAREPVPDVAAQALVEKVRVDVFVDHLERLRRAVVRMEDAEAQVAAAKKAAAKRAAWARLLDARAALRVIASESLQDLVAARLKDASGHPNPCPPTSVTPAPGGPFLPPARAAAAPAARAPSAASDSDKPMVRAQQPGARFEAVPRQAHHIPPGAHPDQTGRAGPASGEQ